MLKNIVLGGLLAIGLGACDASKDVQKFADRACECKDKDCAKKVMDDFVSWVNDHKDATGDEKKAEEAMKKMVDCAQKAGLPMTDLAAILQKMNI